MYSLQDFQYYEEGKDQGINVREKSKQLEALLKDDERLKNERVKALKARERFAQQTTGFGTGSDSNVIKLTFTLSTSLFPLPFFYNCLFYKYGLSKSFYDSDSVHCLHFHKLSHGKGFNLWIVDFKWVILKDKWISFFGSCPFIFLFVKT